MSCPRNSKQPFWLLKNGQIACCWLCSCCFKEPWGPDPLWGQCLRSYSPGLLVPEPALEMGNGAGEKGKNLPLLMASPISHPSYEGPSWQENGFFYSLLVHSTHIDCMRNACLMNEFPGHAELVLVRLAALSDWFLLSLQISVHMSPPWRNLPGHPT